MLILPLLGGLIGVNRYTGNHGPKIVILSLWLTAILGTIIYTEVILGESPVYQNLGIWWSIGSKQVEWEQIYDSQTVSMFIPILYISAQVQLYSYKYMETSPHRARFHSYLAFFTFFMLILIMGNNQLILFIGWEGVGVISYLLVNFWHTRLLASFASQKAFQMNRLGDIGLLLAIIQLLLTLDDISLSTIFTISPYLHHDLIITIVIALTIASMAKSGQIGQHTWQTSAMEGPTPVSALLHSATMVTAGVYLLMRFSPLLEFTSTGQMIITLVGSISAQLGGCGALLENDQKKIIAYSTISQLGYMFVAIGVSHTNIALFHLINHGFFKAQQFQSAGSIIHAIADIQDIRKMGGQAYSLPITYGVMFIGSLSLLAFPFLTGYYSKDLLQELLIRPINLYCTFAYIMTLLAAILTSIYSFRQLIMVFLGLPNVKISAHEPHLLMILPLIILMIGSVIAGYILSDQYVGIGTTTFNSYFIHPSNYTMYDLSVLGWYHFGLELLPCLPLLLLIWLIPYTNNRLPTVHKYTSIYNSKLYMSTMILPHFNIYYNWIIIVTVAISNIQNRYIDKGIQEVIGPQGSQAKTRYVSQLAYRIELQSTGYILHLQFIFISLLLVIMIQ